MALVQKTGDSSLADSIQNLLNPSRSPARAALQGWHQGLSLRCQLGDRDAQTWIQPTLPSLPHHGPGVNTTSLQPYNMPLQTALFQQAQAKELETLPKVTECRLGSWGGPLRQQCPLPQIPNGGDP